LVDVAERALCNNPQTREAWATARVQAAQVGAAESAYLPSLSASAALTHNETDGRGSGGTSGYTQQGAGVSLSYLLYDFGGRDASRENARQVLSAVNATQDAAIQSVFLSAVQAYYQLFSAQAAVAAATQAEKSSLESFKAADARYGVGAGTPADKLQAQTAYSQAALNRITAAGNTATAQGVLANVMGLDANAPLSIAPVAVARPDEAFSQDVARLIEQARQSRPELAAAEAQVKAAQANVSVAKASGMPNFSLTAGVNYNDSGISDAVRSGSVGVAVSVPLFTGYNTTYRIRAAQEQVEARRAQRDRISQQVALDVWKAYQSLLTQVQTLKSSADLLASATQSEQVALGRYKAGVGNILDVLTAQSALASARQQDIQALYGWYIAKATLAQAMGQLDFAAIASPQAGQRPQ
jgi:outer membrane protein